MGVCVRVCVREGERERERGRGRGREGERGGERGREREGEMEREREGEGVGWRTFSPRGEGERVWDAWMHQCECMRVCVCESSVCSPPLPFTESCVLMSCPFMRRALDERREVCVCVCVWRAARVCVLGECASGSMVCIRACVWI